MRTREQYQLNGTGIGTCLLMVQCGIGDDICAMPAVASLKGLITIYTHHPDLWAALNVTVVTVKADNMTCSNGEYLLPDWDNAHLTKFERIFKLNNWGGWEDDEQGFNSRPRFEQLADLLEVKLKPFDFKAALNVQNSEQKDYTLLAVESNEHWRSLPSARDTLNALRLTGEKVVWLTEFPNSRPEARRCKTWAELLETVASARRVIAVDNGIAHIAAALGKPLTILGGMTNVRDIFSQYGNPFETIQAPFDECQSPCYRNPLRGFGRGLRGKCCGVYDSPRCMESITPHEILLPTPRDRQIERKAPQKQAITGAGKLHVMQSLFDSNVPGAVAELGVYQGGSAKVLAFAFPDRPCLLFDTFEGIPFKGESDTHDVGEFSASMEEVRAALEGYPNVTFVKGVFPDTASPYKDLRYAFVYLDADQYQSTKDGLEFFWPRMSPGGIIALDDYRWPQCPGVEKALLEFGIEIHSPVPYFAFIKKGLIT